MKRNTRKTPDLGEEVKGIPVMKEYKYLGTVLDSKLRVGPQLNRIKKKSGHLYVKLYPYLAQATAEARRDMWQTMVSPLFNAALALLYVEPSKKGREDTERLWRMTFKRFMMIPQGTQTELVNQMMNRNLQSISINTAETSKRKWEGHRLNIGMEEDIRRENGDKALNIGNPMKGIPNSWCKLLKLNCKPCPKCKERGIVMNAQHLNKFHHLNIQDPLELWDIISTISRKGDKRSQITRKVSPIINQSLERINNFLRR